MNKKLLLLTILILLVTISTFSLGLVKQYNRPGSISIPSFEKEIIKRETKGMNEKQIINYGVKLTSRTLIFFHIVSKLHSRK